MTPSRAVPYPTLYISHGGGGNEADWFTQGVANRIIDNLINAGKMQPAVVVATNFNGLPNGNAGYQTDVLTRVIPFIESRYNVSHNASERAFAGLSAGGSRANQLIFNATTSFGYYATWSIGTGGAPPAGDAALRQPGPEEAARARGRRRALRLDHRAGQDDVRAAADRQRRPVPGRHGRRRPRVVHVAAAAAPLRGRGRVPPDVDGGHGLRHERDRDGHAGHDRARRADRDDPVPAGGVPLGAPVPLSGGTGDDRPCRTRAAPPRSPPPTAATSFYNASSGTAAYEATTGPQNVGGTVPATSSLTLGGTASFGAFTPGADKTYTAQSTANVVSTAGDAALTASGPVRLSNGAFTLSEPLRVAFSKSTWSAPVSNDPVTIAYSQHIGGPSRCAPAPTAGRVTFTLSTTNP